ncbi:hypothetical protein CONLIGDRAFT_674811 [Coniochaeta ligniaria NRRL 30616]|uniref:Zn(2)-C6 fungal-type domain-containing protein n=1 Tax=Coniochaeta ligniaria NRRL 30616 TaxID=1408157 RepID=A0A1J7J0W3_9PEZI|nr:hypothetical protein CONLIGDRAFT_674811 [Coniochaeta ligniaria NRRL 30616]
MADRARSKACDACRTRKLKCSNRSSTRPLLPICDNCVRSGIACVSSEQVRRRRPRSGKIVDALRSDSVSGNTLRDHQHDDDDISSRAWTGIEVPVSASPSDTTSDRMSSHPLQHLTLEHTTEVFTFFMHNIYATLPIINFDDFTNRLEQGDGSWDIDFIILGHALDLLHEAYIYTLTPTDGTGNIISRMSVMEQLRCTYDYAEEATANTVIVSFALFVACSVVGKHQRALLYQSEASKLADFARMSSRIEAMRIQRLKALLFVAASASALLSGDSAWRVDMPSSLHVEDLTSWYSAANAPDHHMASDDIRDLDRFAIRQLQLMTRMHMMAGEGSSRELLTEDDVANTISSVTLPATPTVRIVTADLSITQLWFSSDRRRLRNNNNYDSITKLIDAVDLPESTGRKALAWARSLSQSELRIVGLGKMVDIVENMVHLCRLCPNSTAEVEILAGDLMAAIGTADYELKYATTLERCAAILRHTASMCLYVEQTLAYQGSVKK